MIRTTIKFLLALSLVISLQAEHPDSLNFRLVRNQKAEKIEILQALHKYYLPKSTDSCERYKATILEQAQQLGNLKNQALTCKYIGYAHYVGGEYDDSLEFYEKSYQLSSKVYVGTAGILNHFGDVHTRLGNNEKAISYFTQAEISCDEYDR